MNKSNLTELLSVLEEMRKTECPEIPAYVIENIVKVQYDNQDDRVLARKLTAKIISDYLNAVGAEGGQ